MTDSLEQEALERARRARVSPEVMAMAIRMERKDRPYVVELEDRTGGSFYRCTQEGPSKVLYINMDHPFFVDCYMMPGSTPRFRDGLELMLWTLGLSELEAPEKDRLMYERERHGWSERLYHALHILARNEDFDGLRAAEAEALEQESLIEDLPSEEMFADWREAADYDHEGEEA